VTSTAAYRALYFCLVALSATLAFIAVSAVLHGHIVLGLAAVALLLLLHVAGFVQRHFLADLLLGLHHLVRRDFARSKDHSQRFIAQLEEQPWRGKFIALGLSAYSRNAEALARNNLGAAMLQLGEFEEAREQLSRAIALDPKGPLPHLNMGTLLLHSATFGDARPWFEKAEALGFKGGWADDLVMASQRRNAARSVRGGPNSTPPACPAPEPAIGGAFVLELLNDERTAMEFVVATLEQLFGMTGIRAMRIMLAVHRDGSAVFAGFDTEAAAQAKADELTAPALASDFPLACRVVAR
jgi:ATP-dependent Clp protease adaptor protein ClpS